MRLVNLFGNIIKFNVLSTKVVRVGIRPGQPKAYWIGLSQVGLQFGPKRVQIGFRLLGYRAKMKSRLDLMLAEVQLKSTTKPVLTTLSFLIFYQFTSYSTAAHTHPHPILSLSHAPAYSSSLTLLSLISFSTPLFLILPLSISLPLKTSLESLLVVVASSQSKLKPLHLLPLLIFFSALRRCRCRQ